MIKLAVSGAQGRMVQSIIDAALLNKDFFVVNALFESSQRKDLEKEYKGIQIYTNLNALQGCDVLIDFTIPEATVSNIEVCLKYKIAMVIGTTGLRPFDVDTLKIASEAIPIVFSSNMSLGVNILFNLIEQASKTMKIEGIEKILIEETHHIHKKDFPSGTAKTMRDIAEEFSGIRILDTDIKSFRTGEVIGDHTIIYETSFDTITISHHAKNRNMFAAGAILAAKFLVDKKKANG